MMRAWLLMPRITPFMLATKWSRAPKSVSNVRTDMAEGMWLLREKDFLNFVLDHPHRPVHLHNVSDAMTD